jgi:hypothetical protein
MIGELTRRTFALHDSAITPSSNAALDAAGARCSVGRHFMGDIVNLNKYRKAKQRDSEAREAEINREKFGRNKAQTTRDRLQRRQEEKALEGKKLEDGSDKT